MNEPAERTDLVVFSILPPDFKLEVTMVDGFLVTSRMGLDKFGVAHASGFHSLNAKAAWMHTLSGELQVLFNHQFDCPAHVVSTYEPDGGFLLWLRSCLPYNGKKLTTTPPDLSLGSRKDNIIDVPATHVVVKKLIKHMEIRLRDKLLGNDDIIDI